MNKIDWSDWSYFAEGNASVALKYQGSSLEFKNKILKLPKVSSKSTEEINKELANHLKQVSLSHELNDPIFSSMGPTLTVQSEIIPNLILSENEIKRFNSKRPEFRLDLPSKLLQDTKLFGVLVEDVTSDLDGVPTGETFTLEIKPKWGFLPGESTPAGPIRKRIPFYQLMQLKKLQTERVQSTSNYNPLELFSEDIEMFTRAFLELVNSPQNNLHIFKGGVHVFGGEGKVEVDDPIGLLVSTIQYLVGGNSREETLVNLAKSVFDVCDRTQVLEQILAIQMLDDLDIETIYELFSKVDSTEAKKHWTMISETEINDIREGIIRKVKFIRANKRPPEINEKFETQDEIMRKVREFLVASTAKDCSVMISLGMAEKGLVSRAKIIDIDVRETNRLDRYIKEARELEKLGSKDF